MRPAGDRNDQADRIPETVSRKALAAGENTADHRRLAPCRSQDLTYPDSLLCQQALHNLSRLTVQQ
jgi:hypothetical protein